jgi:PncC family amidohydrolase
MSIATEVSRVARLLKKHNLKVVFAESCTGGLVAGALTRAAGISAWHCGGMVVYRNTTKQVYLGISGELLEDPGPVSAQVAREMAESILSRTPEADISAAVTGHLGPDAPPELDGVIYIALGLRPPSPSAETRSPDRVVKHECRSSTRNARQREAVQRVLAVLADFLSEL